MGRWTHAWPHVRAALIAAHVASIVVLSTPGSAVLTNKKSWSTPNARAEFEAWTQRLRGWGIATTPDGLRERLYRTAVTAGSVRDSIAWPFAKYGELTGAQQGWQMFVRPQKYPAELHIDVQVDGQWQPLVRPWESTLDWRAHQRRHNRVRKLLGRFARTFYADRYAATARWFARAAAHDRPDVTAIRVRLYRYRSADPQMMRAGTVPTGHYEHELVFDAEALR